MMKNVIPPGLAGIWIALAAMIVPAQSPVKIPECFGKNYAPSEVTRRAKVTEGPDLRKLTEVARGIQGRVVVDAVFCRNGRLTDIHLSQESNPTINEFISSALSLITFIPAELNFHSVSQRTRFEFELNGGEAKEVISPPVASNLVESLNIIGIRRFTARDILFLIHTRAGEPYDEAQVKRDFDAIIATNEFDKLSSRVTTETECAVEST